MALAFFRWWIRGTTGNGESVEETLEQIEMLQRRVRTLAEPVAGLTQQLPLSSTIALINSNEGPPPRDFKSVPEGGGNAARTSNLEPERSESSTDAERKSIPNKFHAGLTGFF